MFATSHRLENMGRAHLLWFFSFFAAAAVAGCSGDSPGCKFDVDCPGTQRCVDGVCKYPGLTEDCEELSCEADEVCVQGACIPADTDADSDGWSVAVDCDDGDAQVHPEALETCNEVDDDCDGATTAS
jgi:hypothetical protein